MKTFITGRVPKIAIDLLIENNIDVIQYDKDKALSQKDFLKLAKDCDALLTMLRDKIDADMIWQLTNCKVIANYAVGFNNIDLKAAKEKNIVVTNTPDVLTDATADLAMSLILACARNIISGHETVSKNKFKGWQPDMLLGIELKNKTVGIVGAGRIGTATAIRAKAFGCKIIYFNRSRKEELENLTGAKKVNLETLMRTSDIISLHLPLNEKSKNLLDKEKLNLMKPNAIIVNTARGEILDENELIKMLKENKIFSAGFDVYVNEPNINKDLMKLKNVVLLPHLGSATFEARNAMAELAAKNIINVLKGKKAITEVKI